MSETSDSPLEKTEKTIEGIVYACGVYFRTLAALAFPFFLTRQFFLRFYRLRKRRLLAPPLLFLSISAFLFSIIVTIIDTADFVDAKAFLRGFHARANLDISITHLLFTIFPTFLCVWLLAWSGRLLVKDKQISDYFCYIFGFFGASVSLWFLANSLVLFDYGLSRNIWLEHRNLDALRMYVSGGFLLYVIVQPFSLSAVTIWRLTRSEVVLKRIVKSVLGLLLLATMIVGSIFIQGIPRRFNEAIAEPARETPITFANWPDEPHSLANIGFDGPDHLFIRFRILAANPRDNTAFIDRKMWLQLILQGRPSLYLQLYANESGESTDPLPLLAKETRLINYQGQLEKSDYQEIVGSRVKFQIRAFWTELTKDGLKHHEVRVLDDADYNLDFIQLEEPKPKLDKGKKETNRLPK